MYYLTCVKLIIREKYQVYFVTKNSSDEHNKGKKYPFCFSYCKGKCEEIAKLHWAFH